MNFTNRLCNPKPYTSRWRWDKGVVLVIEADSYVDLTAEQARDFHKGQPGSESVQDLMRQEGLFILDLDRPYDVQALECLDQCAAWMKRRYNDMENRLRQDRASQGISENPAAFAEIIRQTGYAKFNERAETVIERARFIRSELEKSAEKTVTQKIDPDRTIPFTNPMKVFPSPLALQMFLRDKGNEDLKAKWEEWRASVGARPPKVKKEVTE